MGRLVPQWAVAQTRRRCGRWPKPLQLKKERGACKLPLWAWQGHPKEGLTLPVLEVGSQGFLL